MILSSILIGQVSAREHKKEDIKAKKKIRVIEMESKAGVPIKKTKKIIRNELKKKAPDPSRLLCGTILVLPHFIPTMADKGSEMAKVKMAEMAMILGKIKIVKRIAIT